MKLNRKFFSALLVIAMMASMLLPVSAAQMEATYGEASYYDIAVEAYSRMLAFHDGVVGAANRDRQYGLITAAGEVRVDFQYDGIWYLADNMFSVEQNGRYGIIDTQGNLLEPVSHWQITLIEGQNGTFLRIDGDYFTADRNFTPVSEDEVYGYGDDGMNELAERLGYDWMYSVGLVNFNRYIAGRYTSNQGYTYYLLDGDHSYRVLLSADWLADAYYDWTVDTLRIVTHDGIYDGDGSLVYDAAANGQRISEEDHYYNRNYGTVIVETLNGSLKGLVDKDGKELIPCEYRQIGNKNRNGYIGAVKANSGGFVDSDIYRDDGTFVKTFSDTYVATEVYYRHMTFRTSENGLNGMMDIDGNVLLSNQYTAIKADNKDNLLVLQGDEYYGGTYGLYDQEGRVIFADGYESISYLDNDCYKLLDNGRYGVMNTSGRTVIPFDYVDMRVHTTDFIEVYDGRQYKIIDLNNNTVVRESDNQIELFRPLRYSLSEDLPYTPGGTLPFCIYTRDEGFVTVYADPGTGETGGELVHRTSNFDLSDPEAIFAYQDDNTDLFGFGKLGASDVVASGYCGKITDRYPEGENLAWELTSDGTLTISGTGEMADYVIDEETDFNSAPWTQWWDSVHSVAIESGATTIGTQAFAQSGNLVSVIIPNSIISIRTMAFYECDGLTNITIPDSVGYIGIMAFGYCSNLTDVTIQSKTATIENSAFYGCDKLADVYYAGTEAQWNEMEIMDGNEPLLNARIHFLGSELPEGVKFVPYSHSFGEAAEITAGRLPRGLSLDEATGELTGAPLESGDFEFTVRKASSTAVYQMTVANNTNSAVQRPNDYEIIENVGIQDPRDPNSFYMDEYREETFAIAGPYEEFYRLLIDGVEKVRDVDYIVREGSTIITIRTQTFRNVGEGTHTIAAEFRSTDSSGRTSMKQAAQNYTLTIRRPSDNTGSGGSSSGSSGSGSTNYSISLPKIPNCTVKVSPTSASEGTRVTLTVKPNTGYVLSNLAVTGPKGQQIPLNQSGDYKYTFRMPGGKADISVEVEAEKPAPVPAGETPFVDMKETDWFYHDVAEVYAKGLMVGTSENTFSPKEQILRGMMVTILYRMAGEPAAEETYFADVPLNQYYTAAAAWAAEQGIVTGYGDGHFGPSDPMTREQIITILYHYANLSGVDTGAQSDLSQFNDLDQLSPDARRAMSWAYSIGLLRGKGDGILDPAGATTRAETAAFLIRFIELTEN